MHDHLFEYFPYFWTARGYLDRAPVSTDAPLSLILAFSQIIRDPYSPQDCPYLSTIFRRAADVRNLRAFPRVHTPKPHIYSSFVKSPKPQTAINIHFNKFPLTLFFCSHTLFFPRSLGWMFYSLNVSASWFDVLECRVVPWENVRPAKLNKKYRKYSDTKSWMKSCHEDVSHLSMNNKIVCASVISLGIVFVRLFLPCTFWTRKKRPNNVDDTRKLCRCWWKNWRGGREKKAEVYNCTIEHTKTSACHLLERNWSAKSCTTFSRVHIQFSIWSAFKVQTSNIWDESEGCGGDEKKKKNVAAANLPLKT